MMPEKITEDVSVDALDDHALYFNRELSLLAFNERVLELSEDEGIPVLERLSYLCISCSNLDEFFEVRVAGLKQQVLAGIGKVDADGLTPLQQLAEVRTRAQILVTRQYEVFNDLLLPALDREGISFLRRSEWNEATTAWVEEYFNQEIQPVLSPLGLDPAHPFPRLMNKSLNFVVELKGKDAFGRNSGRALVRAPRSLPRVIPLPKEVCGVEHGFVFLSAIIHSQMASLFPGLEPVGVYQFKVTRNSDLYVHEEDVADLRIALEDELFSRNYGNAVRLEVASNCPDETIRFLLKIFGLGEEDLYKVNGPVNLPRLFAIPKLVDRPELKFPPFVPHMPKSVDVGSEIFNRIRKSDILLHHPYQSYKPVVELVRQAARDPKVLAIKQTLYRTGEDSPFVRYLMEAARAGKDVTVVVELRARFDEEANIKLATELQEAGIQVVYGIVGYKTHAKLMMIVRREKSGLMSYVHVGTGNYHTRTAHMYTDFSYITCNKQVASDTNKVFTQLSGLGKTVNLKQLLQSPFTLHKNFIKLIQREAENARAGKPAHIMARMNSLLEPKLIKELYLASQAGVRIELVVRGICALRPGVEGISDNIRVVSALGRFLEHSRVYYFMNDGDPKLYISSADWMQRNCFSRVEVALPVESEKLFKRIYSEAFDVFLKDNYSSWTLQESGEYSRNRPGEEEKLFSAQMYLIDELKKDKY